MATDAEKGLALLKSIVAKHDTDHIEASDHNWRVCRRCLAIESLDNESAIRELRALVAKLAKIESDALFTSEQQGVSDGEHAARDVTPT